MRDYYSIMGLLLLRIKDIILLKKRERGKAYYTIIKILIKITYNTYNTRINSNINIHVYTIIVKSRTLLYKIIRENATLRLTVNNL